MSETLDMAAACQTGFAGGLGDDGEQSAQVLVEDGGGRRTVPVKSAHAPILAA